MSWPSGTSTPLLFEAEMMEILDETQPHDRQDLAQDVRQQIAHNPRVGQDLGESSGVKQKKLRSEVWEDFAKYKDENGKDWARCNVCKKEFDGSSKSGTTHLRNHLKSCQRKRNGGGGVDESAIQSFMEDSQHIRQKNTDDTRVGLDLGESSRVKPRKKRSDVWQNFEKCEDEQGEEWARCNLCNRDFKGSSKLGTTHLRNHLKSCQRKRNGGGGGDEPAKLASNLSNPIAIKEKSVMDQQLNYLDSVRMIIKLGDINNVNSTNVRYIINVYDEEKKKLRSYFEKLSCRLCLTIIWEDDCIFDHGCVMVWFIDDDWKLKNKIISIKYSYDLMEDIKNLLLEWGIESKLSFMVMKDDDYEEMNIDEREDRFSNQGSLLFNNMLLCAKSIRKARYDLLIRREILLNDNIRNAIDEEAIKSLGNKLILMRVEENDILSVLKNVLCAKEAGFELENIYPSFQNLTEDEWDVLRALYELWEDEWVVLDFDKAGDNRASTCFPLLCGMYKCYKKLSKFRINCTGDV